MEFEADGAESKVVFRDHIYKYRNSNVTMLRSGWYFHSEEVLRYLYWKMEPGEVVVDAGACYGSYTIPALLQGATVYAYEPYPPLYEELKYNVEVNGLSSNLKAVDKALWSTSGQIFALPRYDLSVLRRKGDNQPIINVSTVTLDDDLNDLTRLDWIKIDTEGAEIEILKGARQLIEKFNPRILVEWHADRNQDPEMKYLEGWKIQEIDPGHYLVQLK